MINEKIDKYLKEARVKNAEEIADNFTRYLIGDKKVAIRRLEKINPDLSLKGYGADEYNAAYGRLYKHLLKAINVAGDM